MFNPDVATRTIPGSELAQIVAEGLAAAAAGFALADCPHWGERLEWWCVGFYSHRKA